MITKIQTSNISFRNQQNPQRQASLNNQLPSQKGLTPAVINESPAKIKNFSGFSKEKAGMAAGGFAMATLTGVLMTLGSAKKPSAAKILNSISIKDSEYLEKLAQGLTQYLNNGKKISVKNLSSIVGSDELKAIMARLKPENYSTGKGNFENVKNGTYRANFHLHTNFSDGDMSVENLLEQASRYANKVYSKTGEPFFLAITDHETVNGAKEAIRIIAENPAKFKNLRLIAGMEKGFVTPSPKSIYSNPTEMSEVIAYAINPFCPKLNSFLDTLQENRKNVAKMIIDEANQKFPSSNFSLEKLGFSNNEPPKSLMMDGQWEVALRLREFEPDKEAQINEICKKFRPNVENGAVTFPTKYSTESTIEEIIDVINDSKEGFLGLAHPAFLVSKGFDSPFDIIKNFKKYGKDTAHAAEIYYQDYNKLSRSEIESINIACKAENLTPTAGLDNHSNNIFKAHKGDDLSAEELEKLLSD